jgi:hypothetical protein
MLQLIAEQKNMYTEEARMLKASMKQKDVNKMQ